MKFDRILKQFNWRFQLVRILVNALALAITAAVMPKIYFVDKSVLNWVLMALMLGVLNALLKPILQFLTLQFIFVTYGLVIVLVNALLLWLLSFLFPNRFAVDSLWWLLPGGLVLGLVSSFLESLLGLTMPIVADEPPELRHQLEEQARQAEWLKTAGREAILAEPEQDLTTEVPVLESSAVEPDVAESSPAGPDKRPSPRAAEAELPDSVGLPPAGPEAPAAGLDEGPSLPEEDELEPPGSVVAVDPGSATEEAWDEQGEDRS
jgi:putative membrane protein